MFFIDLSYFSSDFRADEKMNTTSSLVVSGDPPEGGSHHQLLFDLVMGRSAPGEALLFLGF
ncbi:MAG: hypothetical protein JRJ16_06730 [Deltaproteobacteria bacterium]|nr:hypothetical protein [Deltaproteobacteria bacterium]